MERAMFTVDEVKAMLLAGKRLAVAGDESVLNQLPAGTWIGGTIPYFMTSEGGKITVEDIYVTLLPDYIVDARVKVYGDDNIHQIYTDAPDNGFSIIIIPSGCETHFAFALDSPNYEGFASRPLIGWVSGVHLDDLKKVTPKVFNGSDLESYESKAVVLHVTLPESKYADIGIVNIFEQGDGDTITFLSDGFNVEDAFVNGHRVNFADYLVEKQIDVRFPLVSNSYGTMVNIAIQFINEEKKQVSLYGPVFTGIRYKFAAAIDNYVQSFTCHLPEGIADKVVFSSNCVLNYLYSELAGKHTAGILGPFSFGEVAYQLLTQTLVYITLEDHI